MARVVGHLSVSELRAEYRSDKDATRARHFQVIWLLAQGRTVAETARLTGFVPRWIEQLLVRYNTFGPSSLGDRRRGNGAKATVLTSEVLDLLRERVRTPPDDGGVWTARKVAVVMATALKAERVAEQRGWEARAARSAGRSSGRGRATPGRRHPTSNPHSKKARRDRRRGSDTPSGRGDRDLRHRRASHRPEADPPPRLGATWGAANRARPPPVRMALCHGLRLTRHRRELQVTSRRASPSATSKTC